jgi:hypothetical protein
MYDHHATDGAERVKQGLLSIFCLRSIVVACGVELWCRLRHGPCALMELWDFDSVPVLPPAYIGLGEGFFSIGCSCCEQIGRTIILDQTQFMTASPAGRPAPTLISFWHMPGWPRTWHVQAVALIIRAGVPEGRSWSSVTWS